MKRAKTTRGKATNRRPSKTARRKPAVATKLKTAPSGAVAGLRRELEQKTRELDEALEQQTATSDVLRVISASPGDLEPVFNAMLENAVRICDAKCGNLWLIKDGKLKIAAMYGAPPLLKDYRGSEPTVRGGPLAQIVETKSIAAFADLSADGQYVDVPIVKFGGARTFVGVPMLKDDQAIGAITVYRQEVRPFTGKQIELLKNFAAQAVIAIENTRLLNELRASLEQQTATADVLRVISSSPGELQPVFEAVLENATRICEAKFGTLFHFDGTAFGVSAQFGTPAELVDFQKRRGMFRPEPDTPLGRLVRTKQVECTADGAAEAIQGNAAMYGGARSIIRVPMLKDDALVGALIIYRQEVRPFTDKQIELLNNFAAQAVIAIENTRLLNELRESLEQQTATSEVLKVISASPGELQPVFQATIDNATRLCGAKFGALSLREGDVFRSTAMHGVRPAYLEERQRDPIIRPTPGHNLERLLQTRAAVHVPDLASDVVAAQALFERAGARALLNVPLLNGGDVIGSILVYREEPGAFTDKQIELVQNFAAQAVIAIENARLLNELRQRTADLTESLDRQTATGDVLRVISISPTDADPVFEAILESACRLCDSQVAAIFRFDGALLHLAATKNWPAEAMESLAIRWPMAPDPHMISGQVVLSRGVVVQEDTLADANYDRGAAEAGGWRRMLGVPMLRSGDVIGVIVLTWHEAGSILQKQIELLQTFAAQAVIAIENARLFNELRQSLQQQTATADVLKLISRSTFDLQTVLDTLAASAAQLCEAEKASINRAQGDDTYRAVAAYGFSAEFDRYMTEHPIIPGGKGSVVGRTAMSGGTVQIADVMADPDYQISDRIRIGNVRTLLGVPLLREGTPTGVLVMMRSEVKPFTDKQIELAQTFADQAVIAIENARLFEAERERTRELGRSLEDLRAAQDRLVQTEKLASLGQLTAGIAHEIKNPLNFVNNFSALSVELIDELQEELAGANIGDEKRGGIADLAGTLKSNLDKIAQHGKRADAIVKNMLLHSREGSGERRPVDVNALVEESLNLAYHGARAEKQGFNITLERSFDATAGDVELYPQEVTRVLLNIIGNGFYAAHKRKAQADGAFEPTVTASTRNLGDRVEIRIRDNGTGIPPEVREKMFNPFFTTKPAGEGTGLGLSISHDIIVKQHAGTIAVDTALGQFTEFTIVLPRSAASLGRPVGTA